METSLEELPSFDRPPLGEVALLAQFNPINQIRNMDYFRLWSQSEYRHLYPSVGEYLELPEFREEFGDTRSGENPSRLSWEPIARYNFRSNERKEQIQFQRDRIGFYWHAGSNSYPRFPALLNSFRRDYIIFEEFVANHENWGKVIPNQCAISYSNAIFKGEGWDNVEDMQRVITFWRNEFSRSMPANTKLEDAANVLNLIVLDGERAVARLYVTTAIVPKATDVREHIELRLIFRGPPQSPDLDGLVAFFQVGHRHIVTMFEAVTTEAMHKLWGKR